MHDNDQEWIHDYLDAVEEHLCKPLKSAAGRFPSVGSLLRRFTRIRSKLLSSDVTDLNSIREVHNELAVAHHILESSTEPVCTRLEYEPALQHCPQRIDFHVVLSDATSFYVEVKTIQPRFKDRWDDYSSTIERGFLPENVHVHHEEDWLGGELWHFRTAARAKMLDYALAFEERIQNCLAGQQVGTVLVFCGDGNRWHQDELEDFVAFYKSGSHRQDDPFSKMEAHYIRERSFQLRRTIQHFAYVARSELEALPRHFIWSVKPPPEPWLNR